MFKQIGFGTIGVHNRAVCYLSHAAGLWPGKNLGLAACEFICWVVPLPWTLLLQPHLLFSLGHLMNCRKGQLHRSQAQFLLCCSFRCIGSQCLSFSIHNVELINLMPLIKSAESLRKKSYEGRTGCGFLNLFTKHESPRQHKEKRLVVHSHRYLNLLQEN